MTIPTESENNELELIFRTPSSYDGDNIVESFSASSTVQDVKLRLHMACSSRPDPEDITLIYAGKVLKHPSLELREFLPLDSSTHILHMVVKATTKKVSHSLPLRKAEEEGQQREGERGNQTMERKEKIFQRRTNIDGHAEKQSTRCRYGDSAGRNGSSGDSLGSRGPQTGLGRIPSTSGLNHAAFNGLYSAAYRAAYEAALQGIASRSSKMKGEVDANESERRQLSGGTCSNAKAALQGSYPPVAAPMLLSMPMMALPVPIAYQNYNVGEPSLRSPQEMASSQRTHARAAHEAGSNLNPDRARHILEQLEMMDLQGDLPPGLMQLVQHMHAQYGDEEFLNNIQAIMAELDRQGFFGERGMPQRLRTVLRTGDASSPPPPPQRHRHRDVRAPIHRGFRLHIRINLRSLLQLAILLVVVYQHCPLQRFVVLVTAGVLLYLSSTRRVRNLLQRLIGIRHNAEPAERNAAADGGGVLVRNGQERVPAVEDPSVAESERSESLSDRQPESSLAGVEGSTEVRQQDVGHVGPVGPIGYIQELIRFLGGFVASLLPALDPVQREGPPQQVF